MDYNAIWILIEIGLNTSIIQYIQLHYLGNSALNIF